MNKIVQWFYKQINVVYIVSVLGRDEGPAL